MRRLPRFFHLAFVYLLMLGTAKFQLCAQARESTLSNAEIDKLRELAPSPPERVMAFVGFINDRADQIDKLTSGKRKPGREEDLHDLMEQIAGILDDLDDNLDEYSKHHNDIRKVLPKLVAAIERWGTVLKTPPEDQEYSVQRKLALESLNDVHEFATQLTIEQAAWFKEHPPTDPGTKAVPAERRSYSGTPVRIWRQSIDPLSVRRCRRRPIR